MGALLLFQWLSIHKPPASRNLKSFVVCFHPWVIHRPKQASSHTPWIVASEQDPWSGAQTILTQTGFSTEQSDAVPRPDACRWSVTTTENTEGPTSDDRWVNTDSLWWPQHTHRKRTMKPTRTRHFHTYTMRTMTDNGQAPTPLRLSHQPVKARLKIPLLTMWQSLPQTLRWAH